MKDWQRAFILHSRPWRETSLILDIFTEEVGRVCVIAKGARSSSLLKGALQLFTPLLVRFGGRGGVKTLYSAEAVSLTLPLSGVMLYSGLYVNELISRILEYEVRFSGLFFDYLQCIQELASTTGSSEPMLRCFELALLNHLGYGIDFLHCRSNGDAIKDNMTYRYCEEHGFVINLINNDEKSFTGRQLRAFYTREFSDISTLRAAKRFTRIALRYYLGDKPLKTRELFRKFQVKCRGLVVN